MTRASCQEVDSVVYVTTKRGDTVTLDVAFYGDAGELLDLTGWSWECQLRDAADALVAEWVVEDDDPATGRIVLRLDAAVTAGLALADFVWDLEGTDAAANVRTVVTGALRVKGDTTHG